MLERAMQTASTMSRTLPHVTRTAAAASQKIGNASQAQRFLHGTPVTARGQMPKEKMPPIDREQFSKLGLIPAIHGSKTQAPESVPYTQNPFAHLSNAELLRNYVSHRVLATGKGDMLFRMADQLRFIPGVPTAMLKIFELTAFRVFFGGRSSEEMKTTIRQNLEQGKRTLVDYAPEGPHINSEKVLADLKNEVLPMVLEMAAEAKPMHPRLAPAMVFKGSAILSPDLMTRLAGIHPEGSSDEEKKNHPMRSQDNAQFNDIMTTLKEIGHQLKDAGVEMIFDAELTWQNPVILAITSQLSQAGIPVTNTLQAYLTDKANSEVQQHVTSHARLKLVRGAYADAERKAAEEQGAQSPVQKNKDATDTNFDSKVEEHTRGRHETILVCTHNATSYDKATTGFRSDPARVELVTLKGMVNPHELSKGFKPAGLRSEYVPYVKDVSEALEYGRRRTSTLDLGPGAKTQVNAYEVELAQRFPMFARLQSLIFGE